MQRTLRTPRTPFQFSSTLHNNLNAYALSATAAGVAVLAITPSAAAEIVYTPANQEILAHEVFQLDLNNQGVRDFTLVNFFSTTSTIIGLWISPAQAGDAVFSNRSGYAAAIPAGVAIGPNGRFDSKTSVGMANNNIPDSKCHGPWSQVHDKYLGLKYEINGEVHFGWARVSVSCAPPQPARMLLTGYAYETIPGKPILAGATSGTAAEASHPLPANSPTSDSLTNDSLAPLNLGLLALGSPGLAAWRRDETH
jgi:hypothetical protein